MKTPYLGKERRNPDFGHAALADLLLAALGGFIFGAVLAAWIWGGS